MAEWVATNGLDRYVAMPVERIRDLLPPKELPGEESDSVHIVREFLKMLDPLPSVDNEVALKLDKLLSALAKLRVEMGETVSQNQFQGKMLARLGVDVHGKLQAAEDRLNALKQEPTADQEKLRQAHDMIKEATKFLVEDIFGFDATAKKNKWRELDR